MLGDEEMMDYIRRHHARKIASGARKEELEEMLKFPEPIQPVAPLTPQGLSNFLSCATTKSNQSFQLC
jgi:dual specificity tyrosine-phosphorylation-regulated kinase 2/3/4